MLEAFTHPGRARSVGMVAALCLAAGAPAAACGNQTPKDQCFHRIYNQKPSIAVDISRVLARHGISDTEVEDRISTGQAIQNVLVQRHKKYNQLNDGDLYGFCVEDGSIVRDPSAPLVPYDGNAPAPK